MALPIQNQNTALLQFPQEIATAHHRYEIFYKTASLVSAIATVVIFGGALAMFLGMVPMAPTWALVLALLSSIGFAKGMGLWKKGKQEHVSQVEYQRVAEKMTEHAKKDALWRQDIEQFTLNCFRANIPELPRDREEVLSFMNSKKFLSFRNAFCSPVFLPSIAHTVVLREITQEKKKIILEASTLLESDFSSQIIDQNTAEKVAIEQRMQNIFLQTFQEANKLIHLPARDLNPAIPMNQHV